MRDDRLFVARVVVLVLTGLTWGARSLQALANPAYSDPVSLFDWLAVAGFSAAFLLTAAGMLILREASRPALNVSVAVFVVAGACVAAAVLNVLEDGIGVPGLGLAYVVSALVFWIGMFVVAGMLAVSPDRSLAFVPLLTGVGFAFFEVGGGVLAAAAWLSFAAILVRRHAT